MSKHEIIKKGEVTWKILRYSNGNIHLKTPYVNGERHGLQTVFYSNGNIQWQIPLVNGKRHGLATSFNSDGSFWILNNFKKGEWKLKIEFPRGIVRNPTTIKLNLRNKKAYVKT